MISTSQPEAREVLSSVLEGCCNSAAFCNDLFLDHRVKPCCETEEERRDAILHHLLNGMCILRPDVPSCKSFGCNLASAMHLSYNVCTLLLSVYKRKHMTVSTFRICCASIDLKTDGSSCGRDLSNKLQQRLTRWGPLHDCEDAVRMISRFDSFGSGSLLELASPH